MRALSKLLALVLAAALQPAVAETVSLDFEDITADVNPNGSGMVQLLDRYQQSSGIQFTGSAWGATSVRCDGIALFLTHDGGCSALILAGNPTDGNIEGAQTFKLNFADGFTGGSSFFYSALDSSLSITLFSGLDGSGDAISVGSLIPVTDSCDSGARFCDWTEKFLNFAGVAKSIVISGNDESLMMDSFSLIKATAGPTPLPEPGSLALAFGALTAFGWTRRRAAR